MAQGNQVSNAAAVNPVVAPSSSVPVQSTERLPAPKYGYQPDLQRKDQGIFPLPTYGLEPLGEQLDVLLNLPGIRVEQIVYAKKKAWGTRRYNHYLIHPIDEKAIKTVGTRIKLRRRHKPIPDLAQEPLFTVVESSPLAKRLIYDKFIFPSEYFPLARLRSVNLNVYGPRKHVRSPLLFSMKKPLDPRQMSVTDPSGNPIGKIELKFGLTGVRWVINNQYNQQLFEIKGPRRKLTIWKGSHKVGVIKKNAGSIEKGSYGDLHLNLTFPVDATLQGEFYLPALHISLPFSTLKRTTA